MTYKFAAKITLILLFSAWPCLMMLHVRHGFWIGTTCWLAYIVAVLTWPEALGLAVERRTLVARWRTHQQS